MRSHEESLKQQTVVAESSAALASDARRRETHSRIFNKVFSADYISARRSKAAARVFNKWSCHKVNAKLRRLMLAGKLTIAVIHHDRNVWRNALDSTAYIAYLFCRQGFAVIIAPWALNQNSRNRFIGKRGFYTFNIRLTVFQVDLLVVNTIELEWAMAVAFYTDSIP